jgi:hypothetical protein
VHTFPSSINHPPSEKKWPCSNPVNNIEVGKENKRKYLYLLLVFGSYWQLLIRPVPTLLGGRDNKKPQV